METKLKPLPPYSEEKFNLGDVTTTNEDRTGRWYIRKDGTVWITRWWDENIARAEREVQQFPGMIKGFYGALNDARKRHDSNSIQYTDIRHELNVELNALNRLLVKVGWSEDIQKKLETVWKKMDELPSDNSEAINYNERKIKEYEKKLKGIKSDLVIWKQQREDQYLSTAIDVARKLTDNISVRVLRAEQEEDRYSDAALKALLKDISADLMRDVEKRYTYTLGRTIAVKESKQPSVSPFQPQMDSYDEEADAPMAMEVMEVNPDIEKLVESKMTKHKFSNPEAYEKWKAIHNTFEGEDDGWKREDVRKQYEHSLKHSWSGTWKRILDEYVRLGIK